MRMLQLMLILLACAGAPAALAHAELSGSNPADHAVLESAPENLILTFSEPVRLTALSVQKDEAAKQSLGPLPREASDRFVISAPGLDDGHYMVSWRALSEDTHVMSGEFMFAVGAGASHEGHLNHDAEAAGGQAGQAAQDHHDH